MKTQFLFIWSAFSSRWRINLNKNSKNVKNNKNLQIIVLDTFSQLRMITVKRRLVREDKTPSGKSSGRFVSIIVRAGKAIRTQTTSRQSRTWVAIRYAAWTLPLGHLLQRPCGPECISGVCCVGMSTRFHMRTRVLFYFPAFFDFTTCVELGNGNGAIIFENYSKSLIYYYIRTPSRANPPYPNVIY